MKPKQQRIKAIGLAVQAGLTRNPSGVPRPIALRLTLFGVGLGIAAGLIIHNLAGSESTQSLGELMFATLTGSVGGAVLGPLGLLLLAHALNRTVRADDYLVGYSGLIRMLLHAGELSFLGALAGGIGGGSAGMLNALLNAVLVTTMVAASLYWIRGLGLGLGLTLGMLMGTISGALGWAIGQVVR
jgi:hypothetical protein